MKVTTIAVSAALAVLTSAQYQGLPQCAIPCVTQQLPQSCNNDPICICTYPNFIDNISCCISKSTCSASDVQKALDTAKTICSGANIQLPSAAGCVGAAASSSGSSTSGASATKTTSSASAASTTPGNPGHKLAVNGLGLAGAVVGAVALL